MDHYSEADSDDEEVTFLRAASPCRPAPVAAPAVGPPAGGPRLSPRGIVDAATRRLNAYAEELLGPLVAGDGPDSITFPSTLTSHQRRHIRVVAAQHGLAAASTGEAEQRSITVYRPSAQHVPARDARYAGMTREEVLSRKLTSILRHRALEEGLEMTEEGYIRLRDVLGLDMFRDTGCTAEETEELVSRRDQKRRFSLARWDGEPWIRANQGHTVHCVRDSKLLESIPPGTDVACCVHGTYLFAWDQILATGGLSRMTRNHIHFAPRPPGSDVVISGMRSDCEVAVFISAASAMGAGIPFYTSANDVILTPGDERGMVPVAHFTKAVRLCDSKVIWPAR